ncbi:hypothetical protein NRP93_001211 [Clostridium botulinum]|nr:hypothetical protein [Clostridium botulinum]
MKKIFIAILSVIMIMSLLVGCGEKKEEVKQEKVQQEQKNRKEEKIDLAKVELNQENVTKLTKQIVEANEIRSITVNGSNINIKLFQEPEDEKNFLIHTSNYFIDIVSELFKNKKVKNIEFIVDSKFDNNQNDKVESRAIDYEITREEYNKINWEDIKLKVYSEPKILYDSLDSVTVHPAIIKNIKK